MRPQMVIINENTLSAMALRMLLVDIVGNNIDVVCHSSFEEFQASEHGVVPHFFVSADTVFRHSAFFRDIARRTIVITEGDAPTFTQSGFHTIDATASEQVIARQILNIRNAGHGSSHPHPQQPATSELPMLLSQREQEVLALLVRGYINKEVADRLNISLATVIFHRNNISEKLQTRSLGRMTIYAVLNNIVSLSEL